MGLAMGGFGICAVGFSAGLIGSSAIVGALFGVAFGLSSGEWQRVVGIGVCIAAAVLAAFVVRFPSPGSLKQ